MFDLASRKSIIVNPPELDKFYKNGKPDIPLMQDCAKSNQPRHLDARILDCIQKLSSPLTGHELTLAQLSRTSFLSESRLAHLFKEQLGISVHQCILWKKILAAVLRSREGYSLTDCAYHVGFSDSSHFNKAFNRMFGVNPTFVLKH
jgi:AraC-like DNA-binding protein